MDNQLLQVHPKELKFIFEVQKQSSCSIQLMNNKLDYVAFKVKTTNVQKYYVRPNLGIINPLSNCEVTITMQAQQMAPPDMKCKDKFLIQSTIVPIETNLHEDYVTSTYNLFEKNGSKNNIEERRLSTILVKDESSSPTIETLNVGVSNQSKDKEIEELKLKITQLDQKLHEAEISISKLEEERARIQKVKFQQKNCLVSCSIL
ncbi:vesicle-associated protein 2-1-like [Cucumis sativus]|uniref:vesicle-associated protein 2-1-like n=1 Tax=Cucumis sativus TaxID=3659 RepID=UPI0012F49E34|nr:vesicle-associated protein 2-1-like [Cucumis sativus]